MQLPDPTSDVKTTFRACRFFGNRTLMAILVGSDCPLCSEASLLAAGGAAGMEFSPAGPYASQLFAHPASVGRWVVVRTCICMRTNKAQSFTHG
jgi:hypothetical protein